MSDEFCQTFCQPWEVGKFSGLSCKKGLELKPVKEEEPFCSKIEQIIKIASFAVELDCKSPTALKRSDRKSDRISDNSDSIEWLKKVTSRMNTDMYSFLGTKKAPSSESKERAF